MGRAATGTPARSAGVGLPTLPRDAPIPWGEGRAARGGLSRRTPQPCGAGGRAVPGLIAPERMGCSEPGSLGLLLMGSSLANAQGAPRRASSPILANSLNREEAVKSEKRSLWVERAQGGGERLRFCLRELPQREHRDTNQCAVFSDPRRCKLMHYLQDMSQAAPRTSPPFPPLCWGGVPVCQAVGSGRAAVLGWKRQLWGSKSLFLGKPKGNSIENWERNPPWCTQEAVEQPARGWMGAALHWASTGIPWGHHGVQGKKSFTAKRERWAEGLHFAMGRGSVPSAAKGGHGTSRPGLASRGAARGGPRGPCWRWVPSDGAQLHVHVGDFSLG